MISTSSLKALGINSQSRLLFIMPHPDDEAVFCSGLIYKCITAKIPTLLLVMTKGEKSTLRFGLKSNDSLGSIRTLEQAHAAKILSINLKHFDFPDGELEIYHNKLKFKIKNLILNFRPSHLVTLEPDGIYGHPDHIALSSLVSSFASPKTQVLYATIHPNFIQSSSRKMAKKSIIKPILPDYELKLSLSEILIKLKTLAAHRSQFGKFPYIVPKLILFYFNHLLTTEYYTFKTL